MKILELCLNFHLVSWEHTLEELDLLNGSLYLALALKKLESLIWPEMRANSKWLQPNESNHSFTVDIAGHFFKECILQYLKNVTSDNLVYLKRSHAQDVLSVSFTSVENWNGLSTLTGPSSGIHCWNTQVMKLYNRFSTTSRLEYVSNMSYSRIGFKIRVLGVLHLYPSCTVSLEGRLFFKKSSEQ